MDAGVSIAPVFAIEPTSARSRQTATLHWRSLDVGYLTFDLGRRWESEPDHADLCHRQLGVWDTGLEII